MSDQILINTGIYPVIMRYLPDAHDYLWQGFARENDKTLAFIPKTSLSEKNKDSVALVQVTRNSPIRVRPTGVIQINDVDFKLLPKTLSFKEGVNPKTGERHWKAQIALAGVRVLFVLDRFKAELSPIRGDKQSWPIRAVKIVHSSQNRHGLFVLVTCVLDVSSEEYEDRLQHVNEQKKRKKPSLGVRTDRHIGAGCTRKM